MSRRYRGLSPCAMLFILLSFGLAAAQPSLAQQCRAEDAECKESCPRDDFDPMMACFRACNVAYSSCAKAENDAKTCQRISSSTSFYSSEVANAWREKEFLLAESARDLSDIRAQLDADYLWTVGDPNGPRAALVLLATVVKTTANLVTGLGGFQATNTTNRATEIYRAIKSGQHLNTIYRKEAEYVAVSIMMDLGANLSPVARAANVMKSFGENVAMMMQNANDLTEARREFNLQMTSLDRLLRDAQSDLERHRSSLRDPTPVEALMSSFQEAKRTCTTDDMPDRH